MQELLYEEYGVLDAQIKLLTEKKSELRAKIVEDLVGNREKFINSSVGKFSLASLKTWTYTPKVVELEEKFKAQKATEQSTGDATFEEKPSLRFTLFKL